MIALKKYGHFFYSRGFSLLELLLVISIIGIISAISSGFYVNYGKTVEISAIAETIVFDLKQMQAKAMIGEGGFKWGIHFVNGSTDYYEFFSTPTNYADVGKVIISSSYLSNSITFSDPIESSSEDIIFNKISGGTSAASIAIILRDVTKTINVSAIGNISVQ